MEKTKCLICSALQNDNIIICECGKNDANIRVCSQCSVNPFQQLLYRCPNKCSSLLKNPISATRMKFCLEKNKNIRDIIKKHRTMKVISKGHIIQNITNAIRNKRSIGEIEKLFDEKRKAEEFQKHKWRDLARNLDPLVEIKPLEKSEEVYDETRELRKEIQDVWAEEAKEFANTFSKEDLVQMVLTEMSLDHKFKDEAKIPWHQPFGCPSMRAQEEYEGKTNELKSLVARSGASSVTKLFCPQLAPDCDQLETYELYDFRSREETNPGFANFENQKEK